MAYKAFTIIENTVDSYGGFRYGVNLWELGADAPDVRWEDTVFMGNQPGSVITTPYTNKKVYDAVAAAIVAYALANYSYTLTTADIMLISGPQQDLSAPRSFTNNPSRTIQTVAASANGFQLSTTRDAEVNYAATIVTAATLLSGAVGSVVLEIAATNSSSAGSWQEIGRITNGQVFSLAVAIGCTQTISGQVGGIVPAGYYARLRSINTTGTPSYTYNSGQEVLL